MGLPNSASRCWCKRGGVNMMVLVKKTLRGWNGGKFYPVGTISTQSKVCNARDSSLLLWRHLCASSTLLTFGWVVKKPSHTPSKKHQTQDNVWFAAHIQYLHHDTLPYEPDAHRQTNAAHHQTQPHLDIMIIQLAHIDSFHSKQKYSLSAMCKQKVLWCSLYKIYCFKLFVCLNWWLVY